MKQFETTLSILCEAVRSIREEEFLALERDCLNTLEHGNKIIATGLGKNVPICEKFVGSLTSMGVPAAFMHTNSAVHGDLGLVREGDLVILLSKSGETAESIYLARLLQKRACALWLLSFCRKSTLYREIPNRLILALSHEGDPWNILPNHSTVLNLIVLSELAMRLVKAGKPDLSVLRANHPGGAIGAALSAGGTK